MSAKIATLTIAALGAVACGGPTTTSLEEAAHHRYRNYPAGGDTMFVEGCRIAELPSQERDLFAKNFGLEPKERAPTWGRCNVRLTFRDSPSKGEHETVAVDAQFVWLSLPSRWAHWRTVPIE